jgi:hypothetical protein
LAVLDHLLAQPAAPTTTVPGPVIQLQGPRAVVLVIAIGVAIAVLWSLPIWLDARRAYKLRMKALDMIGGKLLNAAARDGLKITELRELLATIGEPATGQRGLSRSLMAFTIITVVGVALVALLLSGSADSSDLRKTVITSLLSILATIVGFYFGTRAAETGAELAAPEQAPPTQPPPGGGGGEATEGTAEAAAVAGAEEEVAAASGDGAEEPATAPDEEAAAAAMADQEDIEGQLDAGLTEAEASPEELDRQAAADHGELPEAEVDYEMPDEDELQPDEAEGEEAEAGEAKEQP